jgi:sulfoxide reductase heme-binding subunit YedZ
MVPLAITSTNKMVKRLGGKRWAELHRLVYLAAIAGVMHFWMLVKSDIRLPLTFGFIILFLLGYRLLVKYFPSDVPVS